MSIITRMFHWEGEYHKTFQTLPTSGLKALLHELRIMKARAGISFNDEMLLEDVTRYLEKRLNEENR